MVRNQEEYPLTDNVDQTEIEFQTKKTKKQKAPSRVRTQQPGAKGKSPNGNSIQVENPKTIINPELHPCGCKPTSVAFVNWIGLKVGNSTSVRPLGRLSPQMLRPSVFTTRPYVRSMKEKFSKKNINFKKKKIHHHSNTAFLIEVFLVSQHFVKLVRFKINLVKD